MSLTCLAAELSIRSAGTNRLAVPPVKLTTVANQPGFPGCQPTDGTICQTTWLPPSVSDSLLTCSRNHSSDYFLDWTLTSLSSGPSSSLYYFRPLWNPGLIDWMNMFICGCEQSCVAGTVNELVVILINSWRALHRSSTSIFCMVSVPVSPS